jgi:hypothetical protein
VNWKGCERKQSRRFLEGMKKPRKTWYPVLGPRFKPMTSGIRSANHSLGIMDYVVTLAFDTGDSLARNPEINNYIT